MMSKARDLATRTGLVQVIPTSITKGASGTASVNANGTVTFSGTESIALDGVFTTGYDNYKAIFYVSSKATTAQMSFQYRAGGSSLNGATAYRYQTVRSYAATVDTYPYSSGYDNVVSPASIGNTQAAHWVWEHYNPKSSSAVSQFQAQWFAYDSGNFVQATTQGLYNPAAAKDGFIIFGGSGTMTGTVRVYGYNNG